MSDTTRETIANRIRNAARWVAPTPSRSEAEMTKPLIPNGALRGAIIATLFSIPFWLLGIAAIIWL